MLLRLKPLSVYVFYRGIIDCDSIDLLYGIGKDSSIFVVNDILWNSIMNGISSVGDSSVAIDISSIAGLLFPTCKTSILSCNGRFMVMFNGDDSPKPKSDAAWTSKM